MSIVDRAKNILLKPLDEWPIIASEPATLGSLFTGYAMVLALIPAVFEALFGLLFMGAMTSSMDGLGMSAMSLGTGALLVQAILKYLLWLVVLLIVILIVAAFSPSFNGSGDRVQAAKLLVYSATPIWVAGALSWIPLLGYLVWFGALAYTCYLIYIGLKPVLGIPADKVAGATIVTILVAVVVSTVLYLVFASVIFASLFGSAMMAGAMAGA